MPVNIARDGAVAVVTISRPEALNAFDTAQLEALLAAVHEVSNDASVHAVVLTGEGRRAFAAGADIREMTEMTATEGLTFGRLGHAVGRAISSAPQPWIAAVNGHALGGGCEIALACDIRIASENASFGQPEVTLGVIPGWGGTQRLTRLVGQGVASDLILTGRRIKADEALRVGIVSSVVPLNELLQTATEMARTITANGPLAVRVAKRMIAHAFDIDLDNALAREAENFGLLFDSHDQKEGMRAFNEKRAAEFTGR